ncbi:bolA-like protein 3 isoform X2 [Vulpes lagopus]|uniref:bolA-like protein 3 isoform X2 n=1 Tax=Vulpes lagopus TaxID=494514 RepID=UPI001BCA09EB|nr:bolA-like protein 3 isoform X2 [Vulpes lagopus]
MAAWSPAAAAPLLRGIRGPPLVHCAQRMFASQTEGELKVTRILKEKFPGATAIKVTDISGGCGAMYEIQIESEEFKEKRTVQQHQMVNQLKPDHINAQDMLQRLSARASEQLQQTPSGSVLSSYTRHLEAQELAFSIVI